ncbi:hypothetical protein [Corynebacterium propinquum]
MSLITNPATAKPARDESEIALAIARSTYSRERNCTMYEQV